MSSGSRGKRTGTSHHEQWRFEAQHEVEAGPVAGQVVLGATADYEYAGELKRAANREEVKEVHKSGKEVGAKHMQGAVESSGSRSHAAYKSTKGSEAHLILVKRALEKEVNVAGKAPSKVRVEGVRRSPLEREAAQRDSVREGSGAGYMRRKADGKGG